VKRARNRRRLPTLCLALLSLARLTVTLRHPTVPAPEVACRAAFSACNHAVVTEDRPHP
jgi:hypothetical protein